MTANLIKASALSNNIVQDPLLSIIVPVYNTAEYLRDCLGSLISNDADIIEIIIIHDGGTDNSLDVATDWMSKNDRAVRARLYDQSNSGLSAARMTGIKYSKGKYIGFLDSDDLANIDALHTAAKHAEKYGCDVVSFRSLILDEKSKKTTRFYDSWVWDRLLGEQKFRLTNLIDEPRLLRLEPNANTRVVRRDFFIDKKIEFPPGIMFEDYLPHAQQMIGAGKIGLLNELGYYYRVNRPDQITSRRDQRRFDAVKSASQTLAFAESSHVSEAAMACLMLQLTRLLSWCAEFVPDQDRAEFCREAIASLKNVSRHVYKRARTEFAFDLYERMVLRLFERENAQALRHLASARMKRRMITDGLARSLDIVRRRRFSL
jgi:hypothetical protein